MASHAARDDRWDGLPESIQERIARLTRGQVECLALVHQHLSSKEIAVRLGISPHTVDQRIRQALAILGVERRGEAARIVSALGVLDAETYQRLIHQPPYIEGGTASDHSGSAVSHQIRHTDRAGEASPSGFQTEQSPADRWSSLPMPFATRSHPRNEMSVGVRLLWIVLIAMFTTFSVGMYLAGLESLARMMRG